jgi:DNA-binding MarR family transcriptional regulator
MVRPMTRRRDSLLEALELFRRIHPAISIIHVLAFLYICENEGLNVSELAALCQTTCATASRTAHAMADHATDAEHIHTPLVELRPNPRNPKGRLIFLTDAGLALRDRLDQLIARRDPIRPPARAAA